MTDIIIHLFDTGNLCFAKPLIGQLTEIDEKALFAHSPELFAILIKKYKLEPISSLKPLISHIKLLNERGERRKLADLRESSHLENLLCHNFGQKVEPFLEAFTAVTPEDFVFPRKQEILLEQPPYYYSLQNKEVHSDFLLFKLFESVMSVGLTGAVIIQLNSKYIIEERSSLHQIVLNSEDELATSKIQTEEFVKSMTPQFTRIANIISGWSVKVEKEATCDPLQIALLDLDFTEITDYEQCELPISEFIIRTLITLIELKATVAKKDMQILLALLSRCSFKHRDSIYSLTEYSNEIFELIGLCKEEESECNIYIEKLSEKMVEILI